MKQRVLAGEKRGFISSNPAALIKILTMEKWKMTEGVMNRDEIIEKMARVLEPMLNHADCAAEEALEASGLMDEVERLEAEALGWQDVVAVRDRAVKLLTDKNTHQEELLREAREAIHCITFTETADAVCIDGKDTCLHELEYKITEHLGGW